MGAVAKRSSFRTCFQYVQGDPVEHASNPREVPGEVRSGLEGLEDVLAVWLPAFLVEKSRTLSVAVFHDGVGSEAVEGTAGVEPAAPALRQ